MNQPLVTVMIPTRHRVEKLQRTLSQLYLSATGFNFEIILMGDDDDPETLQAFDELQRDIQGIRTIVTPRLGYVQLDSGYYARMEREAQGEFVWIAGDDMLVTGDWFGELSKVPRTGFIVQPEMSRLRESEYPRAEGQAFPIFPRFCWQQFQENFPVPFDTCGSNLLLANGWKTWFLEGVTMWHDRPDDEEIARHRQGDYYMKGDDGKVRRVTTCHRCGVEMKSGQAIPTAIQVTDEGIHSEAHWDGTAPLVSVLKCPACGHSFKQAPHSAPSPPVLQRPIGIARE